MRGTASKKGNDEVFLHMSNHYRRMYNAKCSVDTSAPSSFRRQQTSHINLCGKTLVNLITNDTKQSPNSYMEHICIDKGKQQCKNKTTGCRPGARSFCKKPTNKVPPIDLIDRNAQNFASPSKAFQPRILKTDAQSRVRNMRVYHPPCRRKKAFEKKSLEEPNWEDEVVSVQLSDLCSAKKLVLSSKESSRDSAYNGGISSGANTPEQASPVSDRYQLDASPSKSDSSSVQCQESHVYDEPKKIVWSQQTTKRDDAAYVHFVHNITEDVLARGIYSDRGLKQLFERHMSNNEGKLKMDRMKEEITKLCRQLGISEEINHKGEMSTCMCSIEELMNETTEQDDDDNGSRKQVKRNTLPDIAILNSQNTNDKPEKSTELTDTPSVCTKTPSFGSDVGREFVNGIFQTVFSSLSSENEASGLPSCSGEKIVNESYPEFCTHKGGQTESHEKFVNVSCQTSKISLASKGVGSFTITVPENDLERVTSEFINKDQCGC